MPMLGEPIRIRFDGLDAASHEMEMGAFAESLIGLSRIIGITANFAETQRFVQHKDALDVRVIAGAPEPHCFELMVWVRWIAEHPLFAGTGGLLTVALITYVFNRAAGQREEMKHLRGALDLAIKELGYRDQAVVDRLLGTIDKMADALKPATRQAVAPLGETAETLTVGDIRHEREVVLGEPEKTAILAEEDMEVGEESTYHMTITELDTESGSCRVYLRDEPETPYKGKITDPLLAIPNNPYALALASKNEIMVKAKPTLKDGLIRQLYISNQQEPAPVDIRTGS